MDVATEQLDVLIRKRASEDRTPDPDEREESWQASVRAYHARRQQQARRQWIQHFEHMARCHAQLAQENEARAAALIEEGGS